MGRARPLVAAAPGGSVADWARRRARSIVAAFELARWLRDCSHQAPAMRCGRPLASLLASATWSVLVPGVAAAEPDASDVAVVSRLHVAGLELIEVARLALTRGTSRRVRSYADRLERDHRMGDLALIDLAKERGWTIGEPEPRDEAEAAALRSEHESVEQLRLVRGPSFDREFLGLTANVLDRAIYGLRTARDRVDDPKLRRLLARSLPLLEQQRALAERLINESGESSPPRM